MIRQPRPGDPPNAPDVLEDLLAGRELSTDAAADLMAAMMTGALAPEQIAGLLVALRAKGVTGPELTGFVRSMREFATPVPVDGGTVVDTCGTGGDRSGTFNVSTVAAIVAAGAGARVAKHGNRSASSQCGSADLLEAAGVVIDLPPDGVARCIEQVGIGFCFAPAYHPAMKHVVPVRRALGVRTVFNFLGPLTNPAGATRQTVGVSDPAAAPLMAEALARLGTRHALVFHGSDGLDELTTTGPSTIWHVRDGAVTTETFDPRDHGVPRATPDQLLGGDTDRNLAIARDVLDGRPGPARAVSVLAAAAALLAADVVADWSEGLSAASASVDEGRATAVLGEWASLSQQLAIG